MRNLYRAFVGVTVVGLLLFNSCVPEDVVVEDLAINLTDGSWTFSDLETGEGSFVDEGLKIIYEDKIGDGTNVISFSNDGSCTDKLLTVNGIGTWEFNANQTQLTLRITYPSGSIPETRNEVWAIKTISNAELSYSVVIPPNTVQMIYTH